MSGSRLGAAAGATAVLLALLTACGGGHGGGGATGDPVAATATTAAPSPSLVPVRGLKDTLRHLPPRTTRATRPHLVRRCTTGTRRVRHSSTTGSGSRRRTRTWYSTEHTRTCGTVRHGTETYRRQLSPERWCVRLDDVDGNRRANDVWYRVDRLDYDRVRDADDHSRVQFVPLSPETGC